MKESKNGTLILKTLIIPATTTIVTAIWEFVRELNSKNGSLLDAAGFFFLTLLGIFLSIIIALAVLGLVIKVFAPTLLKKENNNTNEISDPERKHQAIKKSPLEDRSKNTTLEYLEKQNQEIKRLTSLTFEPNNKTIQENTEVMKTKNPNKEDVINSAITIESNNEKNKPLIRKTTTPYIDPNEVQVKIIKSVPDPGKSEPKRIGYLPNDNFKQIEPYKYAVIKMPHENSIIKFPRKGRSDKKGYTEDEFMIHLNKHFKSHFNVFNDRHVPTPNGRPYEPDFVLSTEIDDKNIFINIEIDEPYDGVMRTPTHSIGDNNLRDDFFIKRGWIVIRFAEIQVHREPLKCCAIIVKVISSIDKTYKSELINESNPSYITQWDNLQAKKWSIEKYREKYLGILNFGNRSNAITEYEITEAESDIAAEKEVPKVALKIGSDNGKLAIKNAHERDRRITFDPIAHRYFIDSNPDTISVTQLIDKFFPEFDSLYWAQIKSSQRGISTEVILAEWEEKRTTAARKGTALHEEIEKYYNDIKHNSDTLEFQYFLSFNQKYNSIKPYRTEWRIFDEDLLIAGTIDMAYEKEKDILYIFDWKRSEKIVRPDGTIKNDTYDFAFGELNHLGNNSFKKYCLQQNIYKSILEKRYNKKISSMNLLVLHESYDKYHSIPIPDMSKEVSYIFNYVLHSK